MVFQSYALYPHMSVYKNMAFGLENSKMPKPEIDRRVREAAELLQITDYLDRKPKALSGGQRQRVAIGRAIVREPKAFLLDEPLSNLDAELRVTMRKELAALHAKIGDTMIYVTHDQTEAMTLADKIVVLQSGRIEQTGAPLDIYNNPQNVFVAGFIGSPRMNLIEATANQVADGWTLTAPNMSVPVPNVDGLINGAQCTVGIRPEHVSIATGGSGHTKAQVAFAEQLGGETYLYCDVGGSSQITVHQPGQLPVIKGQTLALHFALENMHLFDANGQVIANQVAR
jgi:multiple sugar transport system ATP-binding protein